MAIHQTPCCCSQAPHTSSPAQGSQHYYYKSEYSQTHPVTIREAIYCYVPRTLTVSLSCTRDIHIRGDEPVVFLVDAPVPSVDAPAPADDVPSGTTLRRVHQEPATYIVLRITDGLLGKDHDDSVSDTSCTCHSSHLCCIRRPVSSRSSVSATDVSRPQL